MKTTSKEIYLSTKEILGGDLPRCVPALARPYGGRADYYFSCNGHVNITRYVIHRVRGSP